jgi:hypothetical protein
MKTKCPCCKGSGEVDSNMLTDKPKRRAMAREMKRLGFTVSAIMKALDYKSPRSIYLACNRKD